MTGFNIVMLIAIILFARLAVRLYVKWKSMNNEEEEEEERNDDSEVT